MPETKKAVPVKKVAAVRKSAPKKKPTSRDPRPDEIIYITNVEVVRSAGQWRVISHFNTGAAHEEYTGHKKAVIGFANGLAYAFGESARRSDRGVWLLIKNRKGAVHDKKYFG